MSSHEVDLYVDPACPWCWLTALWLFEVERVRPVTVTTRLFSLAEINKGKSETSDALAPLVRAERVLVGARRAGGGPALRATYLALGEAHHERDEPLGELVTLRSALAAAGLDASIADGSLADDSTRSEVLADHAAIAERGAFGVPTLVVDGSEPFFGPIVDRRIAGEEAGNLWDIVGPVLREPRVFEIKRNRPSGPQVGRRRDDATEPH